MKIKRNTIHGIALIFIILAFLKPGILENYALYNKVYNIYTLLISLLIIVSYLSRKKISKLQLILLLQFAINFISTTVFSKDYYTLISLNMPLIAISMLSEMEINKDATLYLRCLSIVIIIELFLNLFSILINPNGIYGEGIYGSYKYFLGYDNYSALFVSLGMIIVLIYNYIKNKKISIIGILTIIIVNVGNIITWVATSVVAVLIATLLILVIFFLKFKAIDKILDRVLNIKSLLIGVIIFFFIIVLFRLQDSFSHIIVDILHKDLTFTGRTFIWDKALQQFFSSPFLGIGMLNYNVRLNSAINIYHAHNLILNILMESGIIGVSLYFYLFIYLSKKLNKIKGKNLHRLICIGFLVYFIITFFDVLEFSHTFYILIVIADNCELIQERIIKNEKDSLNYNN